ncbi:MAG: 5-formyltetrahydrofolate cyclo-ligase [Oscillospiraceae bacterium]|nr:5-formyltetrahydrofolate cyclo-ligase [Oscillospiraceae bacterium]
MATKQDIRRKGIEARRGLTHSERKEFSERIVQNLSVSPFFISSQNIMIYAAREEEVDLCSLTTLPESSSKRFFYPKVSDKDMIPLCPADPEAWTTGSFGIKEPDPLNSDSIEPDKLDLVICPCTSFDENCSRIGMGGGYYDRFLPRCISAKVIAVAFECQRTEEVPTEYTDIGMEAVFTEKTIYTANK